MDLTGTSEGVWVGVVARSLVGEVVARLGAGAGRGGERCPQPN